VTKIIRNRAQCLNCGDVIESVHHHDYVSCNCNEIAVDGGRAYLRASAKNLANFKDLSEVVEDESDCQVW
jgi:hypothetical protein